MRLLFVLSMTAMFFCALVLGDTIKTKTQADDLVVRDTTTLLQTLNTAERGLESPELFQACSMWGDAHCRSGDVISGGVLQCHW